MITEKRCSGCGETKPLDEFHRHPSGLGGRSNRCKSCAREYHRQHREKRGEVLREQKRAYAAEHRGEARIRAREWHRANRERALAASKAYYQANAERIKASAKAWREANRERKRENDRRFRAENNERVREYQRRYRAHKAGVMVGPVDRAAIFERDHGLCGICGGRVDPTDWHLDHVIPLSQGGPHVQENMQIAHPRCNQAKGGRLSR